MCWCDLNHLYTHIWMHRMLMYTYIYIIIYWTIMKRVYIYIYLNIYIYILCRLHYIIPKSLCTLIYNEPWNLTTYTHIHCIYTLYIYIYILCIYTVYIYCVYIYTYNIYIYILYTYIYIYVKTDISLILPVMTIEANLWIALSRPNFRPGRRRHRLWIALGTKGGTSALRPSRWDSNDGHIETWYGSVMVAT